MNENKDKYNKSSGYYNDICYTTTSKDGTDIILKDRKKFLIEGNNIVYQEGCEFSDYYSYTLKAECKCKIKESSSSMIDININKTKLLENFKDIKNFVNINILFCYKKLFKMKGISNNIGYYLIAIIIIFFHMINIFIFCICQFSLIKTKIKDITVWINESQNYKAKKIKKLKRNKKIIKNKFINRNSDINKMIVSNNINKRVLFKRKSNSIFKRPKLKAININNNNFSKIKNIIQHYNAIQKNNINNIATKNNNDIKDINSNLNKNNLQKKMKNVMKYIDEEINTLPYNLALIKDKRTYCQYYISLLKTKHNLIFALFNNDDYNSRIIKIDLFFIGFVIGYVVNALFYNDDTMHNIYESKGKFDLETRIPIIIYSSLISMILKTPLHLLALSNDAIINFKKNKSKINLMKRAEDLNINLTIKFVLFFINSFLLLLFFWYYISMFGVIYRNTQIHLLKDTLMSFGLSLFIPFVIYLIPGLFRIPALSNNKNKRECLFNFSKILQLL